MHYRASVLTEILSTHHSSFMKSALLDCHECSSYLHMAGGSRQPSCALYPGGASHQVAWSRALKQMVFCQARDWTTLVSGFALWAQNSGFQKPLPIYKRSSCLCSRLLMPLVSQQKSEGFLELHSIFSSHPEVSTLTAPRSGPDAKLSGFSGSK